MNPQFIGAPGNFRVQPDSPAVDTGRVLTTDDIPDRFLSSSRIPEFREAVTRALNFDIAGVERPQSSGWDMGAYER